MQYKNWFNCAVKMIKHSDEGKAGKSTEQHLIQAYTYSEAEAGIHQIMQEVGGGTFEITNITKTNIAEVHPDESAEKWFKVKISLVAFDEESGREKQTSMFFLMQGDDVGSVYKKTKETMRGYSTGYVIPSVVYSKILEVYASDESEESYEAKTEVIHEDEFKVESEQDVLEQVSEEEVQEKAVQEETSQEDPS
ncbi:MAG: DUF4494 domain-containing protein [Flavobacteriales bacterium]|nr:DUF4494 domain-containing protein [Flavobacteriales bacterium]